MFSFRNLNLEKALDSLELRVGLLELFHGDTFTLDNFLGGIDSRLLAVEFNNAHDCSETERCCSHYIESLGNASHDNTRDGSGSERIDPRTLVVRVA